MGWDAKLLQTSATACGIVMATAFVAQLGWLCLLGD